MQFVVVDLGADTTPDRIAWVLEACTSAMSEGRCVADRPEGEDSPEAIAIVRVKDLEGRWVRIEVGRRTDERALWSVRELSFADSDPPVERWRSVGLALATMVGEIEQARAEPQAEDEDAAVRATAAKPADSEATPTLEAETERPAPAGVAPRPDLTGESSEPLPLPRPRAFVGAGGLVARGIDGEPLRWGGGARLGWLFASGVQLELAGNYSRQTVSPELELDWLRFTSGVGYRYFASERWSFGLTLRVGVRGLGTEAEDEGERRSNRSWSPLVAGSADLWWQALSFGGLWLEFELGSIGRKTRLLDSNRDVESEVPLGDAAAMMGLWFSL